MLQTGTARGRYPGREGDMLLDVNMNKHLEVSRIAFGQGGSVIEIELSEPVASGTARRRSSSNAINKRKGQKTHPEFIAVQTQNGRYRMILHYVTEIPFLEGKRPCYALYAVNWVSKGLSDPMRLPESVLMDFCRALLSLGFDIDILPEEDEHFRYTCARNVFEEYREEEEADCRSTGTSMQAFGIQASPLEESFWKEQDANLSYALPIETSVTIFSAIDLLDMGMMAISRRCCLKGPAAVCTDAGGCVTTNLSTICSSYAHGVRGSVHSMGSALSPCDDPCDYRNGSSSSSGVYCIGGNGNPSPFSSQDGGQQTVAVVRVNCGNLEKHALRAKFFRDLVLLHTLQSTLSSVHLSHTVCPELVSHGVVTWQGQQYFFFDNLESTVPLYLLMGRGGRSGYSVSRSVRERCASELMNLCKLFNPASEFLLLHPGDDLMFAENFLVDTMTGEVYLWSFRDAVCFQGNKVAFLGFRDTDQRSVVSREDVFSTFAEAMKRIATCVLVEAV